MADSTTTVENSKFNQKGGITRDEILQGRDAQYPLSPELVENLNILLERLNKFRQMYGKPMVVTSGYRPAEFNKAAGGAQKSNHMICLACDFKDIDGSLDAWCMQHLEILEQCGLYLEHPDSTPGWSHLQAVAPRSGNRIFRP